MRIGVVGTGVAGALLADLLRGAPGVAVEAFERVAEGSRDEAGTGLNICPNALKALRLHHPARHADLGRLRRALEAEPINGEAVTELLGKLAVATVRMADRVEGKRADDVRALGKALQAAGEGGEEEDEEEEAAAETAEKPKAKSRA